MSLHGSSTPSSTTGSSAGSPPALQVPHTPVSPIPDQLQTSVEENTVNMGGNDPTAAGPPKRKPSRRANTAERRATHNAVERQRRETLNGRFLDLAALLPNLATVRRPSKSAIVNSSIALLHQNRRHRLLAARHLRLLKVETDALRRELNEWRDRSGLPRIEEQNRAPEFLELLGLAEGEGGENWWDGEPLEEMGEEERKAYELVGLSTGQDEDGDDALMEAGDEEEQHLAIPSRGAPVPRMANIPAHVKNNGAMGPQGPIHVMSRGNVNVQQQIPHMHQRGMSMHGMPTIASPSNIQFDHNPMISHPGMHSGVHMYDPTGHPHPHSHSLPVNPHFGAASMGLDDHNVDKVAAWNTAQLFNSIPQAQNGQWVAAHHTQQAMFTPPGTAGSNASNTTSPISIPNPFGGNHQAFMNMQQHQQQQMGVSHMSLGPGHVFGSPEADDASSVSSVEGGGNVRSAGGSPQPHSNMGAYEAAMAAATGGGYGGASMRRPSLSLNTGVSAGGQQAWSGAPQTAQPQMISVSAGGGGSGRGFAPMMNILM